MASFTRQKEALRAATLAYLAGAHRVTDEVGRLQGLVYSEENDSLHREMLLENYTRFVNSRDLLESFADIMNGEELYPFGDEWVGEIFNHLIDKVKPIPLFDEENLTFRFKPGFKKLLKELASGVDSHKKNTETTYHWLSLVLNTAFHCGMSLASQVAENSSAYYEVIEEVELEEEPWSRYPQLTAIFERQLRRETKRSTGLVTDVDYEDG